MTKLEPAVSRPKSFGDDLSHAFVYFHGSLYPGARPRHKLRKQRVQYSILCGRVAVRQIVMSLVGLRSRRLRFPYSLLGVDLLRVIDGLWISYQGVQGGSSRSSSPDADMYGMTHSGSHMYFASFPFLASCAAHP